LDVLQRQNKEGGGIGEHSRGMITIIPAVNTCGIWYGTRNNPVGDFDINRNYHSAAQNETLVLVPLINKLVMKIVDTADLVVDLHEGWGYTQIDENSIGSGIYTQGKKDVSMLKDILINDINTDIHDNVKKFSTHNLEDIPGGLREYCNKHNIGYMLIETSGQKDIQPLSLRVAQHKFFVTQILRYVNGVFI
jgi:predicted deacylase